MSKGTKYFLTSEKVDLTVCKYPYPLLNNSSYANLSSLFLVLLFSKSILYFINPSFCLLSHQLLKNQVNTERRVSKGRYPLPSYNKIYVKGYLAKYLSQLESDELNTRFSHRFWVRGHFKRFWNKERYKRLYDSYEKGKLKNFEGKQYGVDEGVLRIWVYPYIKGEGLLIEKGYQLK